MIARATQNRLAILMAVLFVLFLPAGCQKDSPVKPGNTDDVRIGRVEVDHASLASSDSTEVRAWVVRGAEPGTPVDGVSVTFGEVGGLEAGTFSKTESATNAQGWASVIYRPQNITSGQVTLKVRAGNDIEYVVLSVSDTPSDVITLRFSTGTGGTSLPADGQTSISVNIKAERGVARTPVPSLQLKLVAGDQFLDQNKNGVFDAQDQLVPTGDLNRNGTWDAQGVLPATVTTDLNGQATFLFKSGPSVGNVYVKATGTDAAADYMLYQHPTTLQVTSQIDGREMLADGVSTLRLSTRVVDWGGLPINGVVVKFVAGEPFEDRDLDGFYTPGTDGYTDKNHNGHWDAIGSITSTETTDETGYAFADYTAGFEAGDVVLRATTTNGFAESVVKLVAIPPASNLALSSAASTLYADGASESELTLVVRDINGSTLAGKKVRVVAGERFQDVNANGIFDAGDQLLGDLDGNHTWTAIGAVSAEVTTDAGGVARFPYRAGLVSGTIWVRATADRNSVEESIDLRSLPSALSMTIDAEFSDLKVFGSGGADNTVVMATCFDGLGQAVPAGVVVRFEVGAGPGGGEHIADATAGVYDARTDIDGVARAVLVTGERPGVIQVRATSGSTSRSSPVVVGAGNAATITLQPLSGQVDFWGSTAVEAFVQDEYGNPVDFGTLVEFTVDEGYLSGDSGPATSLVTTGGNALATYQALGPSTGTDYLAVVEASVPGTSAHASTTIQLGDGQPVGVSSFRVLPYQPEIAVQGGGGTEEAVLTVTALDASQRSLGAGYPITFEITAGPDAGEGLNGHGWGPTTVLTNRVGDASVRLRSGNSPGAVAIQYSAPGSVTGSANFAIAAGSVATVECFADSSRLSENSSCRLKAYVYDNAHNPVPNGTLVYFSCDEGVVTGFNGLGSSLTDAGVATATYQATLGSAEADGLAHIVCATSSGVSCTIDIAVPSGPGTATSLSLAASLPEIGVLGTGAAEQVRMSARAYDSYSRPVRANVPVIFSIEQGPGGGERFLTGPGSVTVMTDASGSASVTLVSGTVSGTVVVRAQAGTGVSNHTSVAIAAGPPHYIYLGHENCNVRACGEVNVENGMTCVVGDVYRNPVRDGTVVYFTTDKGVVEGGQGLGSAATSRGLASATFRSSGDACEYVTVTASTLGGTLTASNTFIASDDPFSATIISPTATTVSLPADGTSTFPLRVEVLDQYGMYVLPTDVDYDTQYGSVVNTDESVNGCDASIAKAEYKSATLDRDYSYTVPDDGIGAVDDMTCNVGFGGQGDELTVQLLTSASAKDNSKLELETSNLAPGASTVLSVTIADRYGNPLGGHQFSFTATGGTVTNSAVTDLWGVASGVVYQAPGAPGSYTITAVDVDPNYSGGLVLSATITVQ